MIKPSSQIFVCGTATPLDGAGPCACDAAGALDILHYLREQVEERGMHGVMVSACECMGLCEYAPVVIVYPGAAWYSNVGRKEADEIIKAIWNNTILKSFSGCAGCSH